MLNTNVEEGKPVEEDAPVLDVVVDADNKDDDEPQVDVGSEVEEAEYNEDEAQLDDFKDDDDEELSPEKKERKKFKDSMFVGLDEKDQEAYMEQRSQTQHLNFDDRLLGGSAWSVSDEAEDRVGPNKLNMSSSSLGNHSSLGSGGPRRKLKDKRGAFHRKGPKDDSDMIGREAFHKKTTVISPKNKKLVGRRAKVLAGSEGRQNSSQGSSEEFAELADIEGTRAAADEFIDLERIKIGRKYVVYRANDPIFKLTEAVGPKETDTKCVFCERDMKDHEVKHCAFCGHAACLRCCHKNKNFQPKPGQTIAVQGLACRICDRKMMHRNILLPEMEQVEYLHQWDINEAEHVLFGTRKDIALIEEELDQSDAKEAQKVQDLADKEKQIKKDQVELKRQVQEAEQVQNDLNEEYDDKENLLQEEEMDIQMEVMTLHSIKAECKLYDEKVTKLLSKEAQVLFNEAFENELKNVNNPQKQRTSSLALFLQEQEQQAPKYISFDENALFRKIEPLSSYERLNFLRSEFDLGRHPNSKGTVNFNSEDDILNSFDPGKIIKITPHQRQFLLKHLLKESVLEEDYGQRRGSVASVLAASMRDSRTGSMVSSTSTHMGGSIHVQGFGEFIDWQKENDSDKYQTGQRINYTNSLTLSNMKQEDLIKSELTDNSSSLDSQSSKGSNSSSKRETRIRQKMKKKLEKKKAVQAKLKEKNKSDIRSTAQQCCHDDNCSIF